MMGKKEIIEVVSRANAMAYAKVENSNRVLNDDEISVVATRIMGRIRKREAPCTDADILDMIEMDLMRYGVYEVASAFIRLRIREYDEGGDK